MGGWGREEEGTGIGREGEKMRGRAVGCDEAG